MKQVIFWGTRGSLPVALNAAEVREKIIAALKAADGRSFRDTDHLTAFVDQLPFATRGSFGGNSSCVEIVTEGPEHLICDMGSGARPLGQAKMATYGAARGQIYHVFISHLHWDHLMGFPFFTPMYIPGNRIIIHGCHPQMEAAFRLQMSAPCFPVDYSQAGAEIVFDIMTPGQTALIAGLNVTPKLQLHAGDSYGYRFASADRSLVYSTDSEHKLDSLDAYEAFVDFFRDADLVIFDAMYSLAEAVTLKADWGHSSNMVGVELCQAAQVKRLALFHHEPMHDDQQLCRLLSESQRLEEITRPPQGRLDVISAYDGLVLDL